ncbi:MAG: 50S ribosomal protein L35 [Candidatus Sumerlaeota bacterium]|nr:50S ribosomal protein L35 [Candidatus Sumerlaeota bacterium]
MPKSKTASGVKKRFKVTATGKLMRHRSAMEHYLGKRSQKRIRRNRKETVVSAVDALQIARLTAK